jgi:hydroxyacylglutathione hydrolase
MFRRFFDEGLAQSSYLLACQRTRTAVVIDPRRDIDEYLEAASQSGLTITHAIETHVHADFVSGARELAALGAITVAGPGAGLRFDHLQAADRTTLRVGDIELTVLHTPGHTPEHISILAREPGQPARLFTGDTLFVGAVGRPDLLGEAVTRQLAGELFDSLFTRLLALDDDVEVYPGHGAGSLCGAGIGSEPYTTIGQERRFNRLLQNRSRDAFVAAVLADLPETPPYFARMKRLNAEGPAVLGLSRPVEAPPLVSPRAAAEQLASGACLIDLRKATEYGSGHAAGAINLTFGPKFGYWAGWIVPGDARVLFVADDPTHVAGAWRQLLRVGIDGASGWVDGSFDAWRIAGLPIREIPQLSAAELRDRQIRSEAVTLIDVRSAHEWQTGHIDGALHIPLGELDARWMEVPRSGPIATVCEGGYRSSLAASLLARRGLSNVMNITDGMSAWRALEAAAS